MWKAHVRSVLCFNISKPQLRKQWSRGIMQFSTLCDSTGHVATSSWPCHVIHVQVGGGLTDKPNVSVLLSLCSARSLRNVHPARFDCSPDPSQNQIRAKGLDFLERIWPTASYRQINLSLASNWGHIQSHSSDLIQDQLSLYYLIRN